MVLLKVVAIACQDEPGLRGYGEKLDNFGPKIYLIEGDASREQERIA